METIKQLYLIGGPNGSGKTTLGHELLKTHPELKFMNADEIAAQQNVSVVKAGRILLRDLQRALNAGESFVWESTLSGTTHTALLNQARASGYKIIFSYVVLADVNQNLARIQQRVALGGHDVSPDVVARRYRSSLMNMKSVCLMSDRWILYYNGDKKITEIARGTKDQFLITDNSGYKKYQDTYDRVLGEIVCLANCGAVRAQRIAKQNGVDVVYRKLDDIAQKTM